MEPEQCYENTCLCFFCRHCSSPENQRDFANRCRSYSTASLAFILGSFSCCLTFFIFLLYGFIAGISVAVLSAVTIGTLLLNINYFKNTWINNKHCACCSHFGRDLAFCLCAPEVRFTFVLLCLCCCPMFVRRRIKKGPVIHV